MSDDLPPNEPETDFRLICICSFFWNLSSYVEMLHHSICPSVGESVSRNRITLSTKSGHIHFAIA